MKSGGTGNAGICMGIGRHSTASPNDGKREKTHRNGWEPFQENGVSATPFPGTIIITEQQKQQQKLRIKKISAGTDWNGSNSSGKLPWKIGRKSAAAAAAMAFVSPSRRQSSATISAGPHDDPNLLIAILNAILNAILAAFMFQETISRFRVISDVVCCASCRTPWWQDHPPNGSDVVKSIS